MFTNQYPATNLNSKSRKGFRETRVRARAMNPDHKSGRKAYQAKKKRNRDRALADKRCALRVYANREYARKSKGDALPPIDDGSVEDPVEAYLEKVFPSMCERLIDNLSGDVNRHFFLLKRTACLPCRRRSTYAQMETLDSMYLLECKVCGHDDFCPAHGCVSHGASVCQKCVDLRPSLHK